MPIYKKAIRALAALILTAAPAFAAEQEKEPAAVLEFGAAGEVGLLDGTGRIGPTAAVEVPVIPHWLEVEASVTSLLNGGDPARWSGDLLFKKPIPLSDTVEFMLGAGPSWSMTTGKVAGELAFDFMYWPTPDRRLGWFVQPTYSYSFAKEHEVSLGVSFGVLVGIPGN
jgi:hypothetical protein